MLNSNKKIAFIIILIPLVIVAILFLGNTPSESDANVNEQPKTTEAAINNQATIATEWQWQNVDKQVTRTNSTTDTAPSLPFTAESVYNALQAVKLDANGNVILDHDALISLDETLERIHDRLDSESLGILQEMIRAALPGKAGEQTAQVVANYYQYLGAKQEFSQINEAAVNANTEETVQAVENDEALYAELQDLREVHIGYDATESMFRVSDANAQYMFDSMKLDRDESLTPETKLEKRKEIEARHIEQSINITNWPARYQAFMNDKQYIMAATLNVEEKRNQLSVLLRQHFDNTELKRIEYLGLDQI